MDLDQQNIYIWSIKDHQCVVNQTNGKTLFYSVANRYIMLCGLSSESLLNFMSDNQVKPTLTNPTVLVFVRSIIVSTVCFTDGYNGTKANWVKQFSENINFSDCCNRQTRRLTFNSFFVVVGLFLLSVSFETIFPQTDMYMHEYGI